MNDKQLKAVAMPGDFIFHSSWFEIFKSFDMATAYAIFMAMITYVQTGAVPADEELRRLTVFLFAHIDTDRQRILSLQPKRRTPAKKKPAEQATESPTEPTTTAAETSATTQAKTTEPALATSTISVSSDSSVISETSQSSHNSHNPHPAPNGPQTPRTRANDAQNPLCGPRMQAARSEHYALRIAQATTSLKAASRRSKTKRHR